MSIRISTFPHDEFGLSENWKACNCDVSAGIKRNCIRFGTWRSLGYLFYVLTLTKIFRETCVHDIHSVAYKNVYKLNKTLRGHVTDIVQFNDFFLKKSQVWVHYVLKTSDPTKKELIIWAEFWQLRSSSFYIISYFEHFSSDSQDFLSQKVFLVSLTFI